MLTTLCPSISQSVLRWFHVTDKASAVSSVASAAAMSRTMEAESSLASLPPDVLVFLLSHVEDPHSLSSFFKSSRMAASLAVDSVLQAKWLTMHRKANAWSLVAQSKSEDVALQLLYCTSGEV
eukprot:1153823-Pelagomonas_calceolata.AAC.1